MIYVKILYSEFFPIFDFKSNNYQLLITIDLTTN